MLRWRWVVLIWLIGAWMTAYGVYIELNLREAMGGGAKAFMAKVFFSKKIAHYRWLSQTCALLGPALIVAGFLCRRNWGPQREAQWLAREATKRQRRAERLRQRSRGLEARDPRVAARLAGRADKLEAKAGRLSRKAERRSSQIPRA